VGDPKQSIYRFRRADIEIYGMVRDRIVASGGEVVGLTCNFRSVESIGRFVDAAFKRLFPADASPAQAAFAPLNARRKDEAPGSGVFRYRLEVEKENQDLVALTDARVVASWIARRVSDGDRKPGDFLVLPYRRAALAFYARELERRNIPVVTTGAGLTVETELRELLVLLEALADPGNPVWTLAALSGLFFGIDPGELWLHARNGRALSFERREFSDDSRVERGLAKLRDWFNLCRRWPIDSALARIVEEVGLVPLAASGEMAESRAGSLVHALEVVGAGAVQGATDLRSAIEAIEVLQESRDIEAPLRPGRTDAVRVMNLHKAKGLEAPVVILAHPTGAEPREPLWHVSRRGARAEGWFQVSERRNFRERVRARPPGWDEYVTAEKVFDDAESARRLYVAVTRARDELVVAECARTLTKSPWRDLHHELERFAMPLDLAIEEPRARERPVATSAEVRSGIESVARVRADAGEPAYLVTSVTDEREAGEEDGASDPARLAFRGAAGRGRDWGTVVHRAIATMGRGRSGPSLTRYCRGLLFAAGREVDERGEPRELGELLSLLARVRGSSAWRELTVDRESRWELAVAQLDAVPDEPARLMTGTVDAIGVGKVWRLVDWKTDAVERAEWEARRAHYGRQVEAYRTIVGRRSGADVRASVERVG
jgi:ATP-dependent helicase/nuclease subunit A